MPSNRKSSGPKLDKQARKSVQSGLAKLKKAGVISKGYNVRKAPTNYAIKKVRKFADVIEGRANAVKAKASVRRQYTDKGLLEERGAFLIVPKEHSRERAKIARGLVQLLTPMKNGREERILLPYKATDLERLVDQLQADPSLNGLKRNDELFSFRLYGQIPREEAGFDDVSKLADYIVRNYQHLLGSEKAFRNFQLVRFKGYQVEGPRLPKSRRMNATGRNDDGRSIYATDGAKRRQAAYRERKAKQDPKYREREAARAKARRAANKAAKKKGD